MFLNKWNSIKECEVIGKFVVLFTGKKMALRIILLFALFIILSDLLFSEAFASPLDNWNMRTSGTTSGLNTVIYSNNTFVAVGNSGVILTSPDGGTWTARNSGTTNILNGVTYGDGIFLVVGMNGKYLTSPDSDTWTLKNLATLNDYFLDVTYGNNTFVVVGDYLNIVPTGTVFISPDGSTWTEKNPPGSANYYRKVIFGSNTFVILGSGSTILTSPDGNSWTERNAGTNLGLYGATFGKNIFLIVGEGGTVLTSPDGALWTAGNAGINLDLNRVTYSNNTFVAVGDSGTILTSPDGSTWTARNSGANNKLNGVTYGNGTFVAVGVGGIILQSDSVIPPPSNPNGGDGGCFIATAAYGSGMAREVKILKNFRDNVLLANSIGKSMVNLYYKISPHMVDFIAKHDSLRALVRWSLLPIVGVSWMAFSFGFIPTMVFILLMLVLINTSAVVLFRRMRMQAHRT